MSMFLGLQIILSDEWIPDELPSQSRNTYTETGDVVFF